MENTNPITFDGEALEEVKKFTCLYSIIDEQGGSDVDVKARIGKTRKALLQLKNIWNSTTTVSQYQSHNPHYERQDSSTIQN
ncbi:unnamed protein product [Schistosoma margrebowiei]|uniref:Uncharacterized protein n=1 Tax=Schistosoma margrebowiei TaxID=48269 RepID=A0A183L9B7_9TREM|nr:unnamed protein product [Schistosoma margrebowiei]